MKTSCSANWRSGTFKRRAAWLLAGTERGGRKGEEGSRSEGEEYHLMGSMRGEGIRGSRGREYSDSELRTLRYF